MFKRRAVKTARQMRLVMLHAVKLRRQFLGIGIENSRKRFGNPVDRLLARYVAEEVMKEIEPVYTDLAWGRRALNIGGRV